MEIKAKLIKPKLTQDEVDVYLVRGKNALAQENQNPIGFWRLFQRHEGANFFGREEFLFALASLIDPALAKEIIIWSVPEGYPLAKHETAMTIEGPAQALILVETLLHYPSTGTRFRTLSADYPSAKYPWVFMGARYLSREDLAIATRALAEEGILSTVPAFADKYIGTESHSQIALWAGLRLDEATEKVIADVTSDSRVAATIRATVAFARANPGIPLYVLGDFAARSVGCFEVFRATYEACRRLGLDLVGGRMDISKCDLSDRPIIDKAALAPYEQAKKQLGHVWLDEEVGNYAEYHANNKAQSELLERYRGMGLEAVRKVRAQLNEAGMKEFQLVASSGIKLEDIGKYVEAGASIVGIGEEAAYYLNKGECNFTADVIGYYQGEQFIPFAKEGREIERIASAEILANARPGFSISPALEKVDFAEYFKGGA